MHKPRGEKVAALGCQLSLDAKVGQQVLSLSLMLLL